MTEQFAKIFQISGHQVLVVIDGGEIKVSAMLENTGICTTSFTYSDSWQADDAARKVFNRVDEKWAGTVLKQMAIITHDGPEEKPRHHSAGDSKFEDIKTVVAEYLRRERIRYLADATDDKILNQNQQSNYAHEFLDRVLIQSEGFQSALSEHPILEKQPHLRKKVDDIVDQIGQLYEEAGHVLLMTY